MTTVSKKKVQKKKTTTMVKLDMTNKQAKELQYYCIYSRNERSMMRLKVIQGEYYSIEN